MTRRICHENFCDVLCEVLCFVKCSVIIVTYLKNLTLQKEAFVLMKIGCQEELALRKLAVKKNWLYENWLSRRICL